MSSSRPGADAFTAELTQSRPLFELLLDRHDGVMVRALRASRRRSRLAPLVRLYESAARQAVVARVSSVIGVSESVVGEWVGRARVRSQLPIHPEVRRKWRGTRHWTAVLALDHHNDLVAPGSINADPDPDMITDYPAAK